MNEELFGERHNEKTIWLTWYRTPQSNNRLKIEPVFDGISTAVTQYKVTDDLGSIWMVGTREECDSYLYGL